MRNIIIYIGIILLSSCNNGIDKRIEFLNEKTQVSPQNQYYTRIDSTLFKESIILNIEYLSSSKRQEDNSGLELDTSEHISYKLHVTPINNNEYYINVHSFNLLSQISNIDTLNILYNKYLSKLHYEIESDLLFQSPKIINIKEIQNLAHEFLQPINSVRSSTFSYTNSKVTRIGNIKVLINESDVIRRCNWLTFLIFGGYQIRAVPDFEYPYKIDLPLMGSSFNDTLYYEIGDHANNEQYLDIYRTSDYKDIIQIIDQINKKNRDVESIKDLSIYSSTKYIINKTSGRIIDITTVSKDSSKVMFHERKFEFIIKYGG